ncbi:MAG: glutamate--tRNA ligase [Candidatus Micrarchaeia archaeon]
MTDSKARELALKFALKNAIDYGKAAEGPVLNKVLASMPEMKNSMEELRKVVAEVVKQVNSMSKEEISKAYEPFAKEFEEKEKAKKASTEKPRMVLEGAVYGDFAARFPPEPNGYIHIGNVKQAFLSQEFARIYHGKLFLYFDDTNPEKDRQEFVDAIKQDMAWLGFKFDKEYYASDMVEQIYGYARQLINEGGAYVCFCKPEEIKKNRLAKRACVHRDQKPDENLKFFEEMLQGKYKEGEAVVRFKGDMQSENATLRDPVILRIKLTPHYRQGNKYRVWPTYYFNTPINDSVHGVTDVIRSKEYELSNELYVRILSALHLRIPRVHEMARLRIKGTPTHKRELKELISKGIISGYDDPRLVTIAGLRRRGVVPEAIRRFVLKFGMSKTDSIISMDMLLAENRKVIDPYAKRLFFVENPVMVEVSGNLPKEAKLRLHPTNDLGYRQYQLGNKFYISKEDAKELHDGDAVCLKDLVCIKLIKISADKIEASVIPTTPELLEHAKKIQWVSDGNFAKCKIALIGELLKNGELNKESIIMKEGFVESYANSLSEGDLVNFERVGFFKLDSKKDMLFFSL